MGYNAQRGTDENHFDCFGICSCLVLRICTGGGNRPSDLL